jgi:putative tryptophan/tyrosine transport system substrate-binding protein
MKRREFIAALGGAAAWPVVASAQQPTIPVIGFLGSGTVGGYAHDVAAFREGLKQSGYAEGQNVAIEYRWAEGQFDRLPVLATDLVRSRVAVIFASGGAVPALAAKAATATIPIVFANGTDPVREGLVPNLNRPGGNITGVSFTTVALVPKRLELLREVVPKMSTIGLLVNPSSPNAETETIEMQVAARAFGMRVHVLNARSEGELEIAFATIADQPVDALVVSSDPLFFSGRNNVARLATDRAVPAIYGLREYAEAGGLMSYGANIADAYRQSGIYVGRILKGDKPGELPVMLPTKFELVVNLKTAKALRLIVPESFLLRADEVIE